MALVRGRSQGPSQASLPMQALKLCSVSAFLHFDALAAQNSRGKCPGGGGETATRRKIRKKGGLIFQVMQPRSSPGHQEWERCKLPAPDISQWEEVTAPEWDAPGDPARWG